MESLVRIGARRSSTDVEALARALAGAIEGEVRFDEGSRALYATDGSNYRQVPLGVVLPRTVEDVVTTVALCRAHGAPVLSRGGGTSLAGQCCNVAVVLDMSKYLRGVTALDPGARRARVRPGTILDTLRAAANEHDLTFGPDPATHEWCTVGGMIGNNSCGPHSLMAGRTVDNVEALEILTYDGVRMRVGATSDDELEAIVRAGGRRGEIYAGLRGIRDRHADLIRRRYPRLPRRVSGYNLDELLPERGFHVARALVGSEGTCVTVLEATVRLVDWPRHRTLVVLGYPDVYQAADDVPALLAQGPIALEGLDGLLVEFMQRKGLHERNLRSLPDGRAFLLAEFGGASRDEAEGRARAMMAALERRARPPAVRIYDDPQEAHDIWTVRESGLGATARVPGQRDTWEGWEDSAVPPEHLGEYLRALRRLFETHGYRPSLYGHFGQGCVHCRVGFELRTGEGIRAYRAFMEEATDLVLRFGGSLSGEHGDGQARAEFLPKMYGPELVQAFREFKALWDPDGKMNPGKLVDPYRIDENLRLGAEYRPPELRTHFRFPDDDGSFERATLRCVGVGQCRRPDGGTMCPSYMVLREEAHTTRGRAHLLFELLRGRDLDGWRDEHVHEALDLCLSCKGCKGDCPVNVDVATLKAEFLSHYYAGRLRPRAAYALGLVHLWAPLGARVPGLANLVMQAPALAAAVKWLAGIAPARRLPAFAERPFHRQFAVRAGAGSGRPPVILWPDTFNDHFYPGTASAAAEVLEAAGFRVVLPPERLCCGRPLYDFGMLRPAKRLLRRVLRVLGESIDAGVPVVGLEPSCVAVFRDELRSLFPDDERARRLGRQAFLFGEFVRDRAPDFVFPRLEREAIVHGHCHHKSLFGMSDERHLLDRLGVAHRVLDAGCCGMAGAFGFERGRKYAVSVQVGERRLLPEVRRAPAQTMIVADGFSCREQIRHLGGPPALHVAEVARMALARELPAPARAARLHPAKPASVAAGAALLAVWGVRARARPGAPLAALGTPAALGVLGLLAAGSAALAILAVRARGG